MDGAFEKGEYIWRSSLGYVAAHLTPKTQPNMKALEGIEAACLSICVAWVKLRPSLSRTPLVINPTHSPACPLSIRGCFFQPIFSCVMRFVTFLSTASHVTRSGGVVLRRKNQSLVICRCLPCRAVDVAVPFFCPRTGCKCGDRCVLASVPDATVVERTKVCHLLSLQCFPF